MNRKQFGISMLFAIIMLTMTTAPRSGQQDSGSYDPWLDYNEDGKIDVNELYRLGEAYGSIGDATRNVTIAGHVTAFFSLDGGNFSIPGGTSWYSDIIPIDGYATVTILIRVSSASNFEGNLYACDNSGYPWLVEAINPTGNSWVKTYDVMNQRVKIYIRNSGTIAITAAVAIYLVA
jgi:hypothetical protein